MASSSRWGSFLQQAVAGVESRLDNILGETEDVQQNTRSGATSGSTTPVLKPTDSVARKPVSSNAANDRLQERLARAIAAKNHTAANSNHIISRTGSPVTGTGSPRGSLDLSPEISQDNAADLIRDINLQKSLQDSNDTAKLTLIAAQVEAQANISTPSLDIAVSPNLFVASPDSNEPRRTADTVRLQNSSSANPLKDVIFPVVTQDSEIRTSAADATSASRQSMNEIERSDVERQQEIHEYIERIDALQAKLQYLARETAASSRNAASAASSGSIEKKIAEKDEQIALLMDEGQKLSKTELKHMTIIKKLRSSVTEREKESLEAKNRAEKLDKERSAFAERLRRIDSIEKQSSEHQKALTQTQKELAAAFADRDSKAAMINQLKVQLQEAASQAKTDEVKTIQGQLDQERSKVLELEHDLSSLKIEKELAAGRAQLQLDELRAKSEREAERARVADVEMKAEQQMLEGRLELLRTRAEEVSSGATGDAQAKLLRQIETLQSQSAIASENWQRIEASMSSQATSLEREKDDALKKGAETRRKAREMNVRSKRLEDEVEEARARAASLERELLEQNQALEKYRKRVEDAELALTTATKAFEEDKRTLAAKLESRIDDEKSKWRNGSYTNSRAESPVASTHRSLTAEHLGLQNLQTRRASARSINNDIVGDRLLSRRSSAVPGARPASSRGVPTPPMRTESLQSLIKHSENADSSSIGNMDQEDYFENIVTPSSPQDKLNDMISISTLGAGPSVQLVERMSAAVRRLETEKVSSKEELARLSAQRDEARAEIVQLMQEVEAKRALDVRLSKLEEENTKINARYQTTLEMLGEKSELVEELKADVQDVKDMYRELVERTIK